MVAKEQQQAPRQKTPKTPTKSSKPDVTEKSDSMAEKPKVEVFKKFYITYAFGQGCEGKVMPCNCASLLGKRN